MFIRILFSFFDCNRCRADLLPRGGDAVGELWEGLVGMGFEPNGMNLVFEPSNLAFGVLAGAGGDTLDGCNQIEVFGFGVYLSN